MRIAHRINLLTNEIAEDVFAKCDGIEFDIRDSNGEIIVNHDAFGTGQLFSDFLTYCPKEKFYIVNVKAEGIEERAIHMLESVGVRRFFLLDCGIPAIMKLQKQGERRLALRFSEVEPIEMVEKLKDVAQWVWVDCFRKYPLTSHIVQQFREWGLKICLVSPDLQGRPEDIELYVKNLHEQNISYDAVCAKVWNHPLWSLA